MCYIFCHVNIREMCDKLNVTPSLIIICDLTHLVRKATDEYKL